MVPRTDIVIAIHATEEFPCEKEFAVCVDSIVANTHSFRLIFVDDCSYELAQRVINGMHSRFPSSLLLRTNLQNWFTRAYNKGLRLVTSPRAIVLNCDTVVGENWLEEMYDVWAEAEKLAPVGLVGSVYSEPEERRWISVKNPGFVTGHCWMVSMDAISKAAERRGHPGWYFDELNHFRAHIHSDTELCWQLNAIGYQTIQSHKSNVQHYGGRSWGHRLASLSTITPEYLRSLDGE